jgi:excisionase family DNA binding protein
MHNLVLSPIDPEKLIEQIAERTAKKVLAALAEQTTEKEDSVVFLSIQEAAAFLNLSVPTVYSKVSRRDLPYYKSGKRLYFIKSELQDFLKGKWVSK